MKNAIYMIAPVKNRQMNSLIVTTEEGGVIVIDGGWRIDAERLLAKLQEITGTDHPHIDAWILSHVHEDHIDAFMEAYDHHADKFSCDAVYYNFPSIQFVGRTEPSNLHTAEEFAATLPKFAGIARTVTEGDCYEIKGAKIEVLYSPDPAFTDNAINNASIILRLTLGKKTAMLLGDAGVESGNKLLQKYGTALKSDYCQMAHHGQNGVTREVYEAIAPAECLWCTPDWLWNNDRGKGFNTHFFKTVIVRGWMDELGVQKNHVTKDGDREILI